MEVDFYRRLPHDATLHTGRMSGDPAASGDEEAIDRFVIPAANALAAAVPHVVAFDCGAVTNPCAARYERRLGDRIGDLTGSTAVGVHAATVAALRENRASRVVVVTPYPAAVNRHVAGALEADGLMVSAIHGMGLEGFASSTVTSDAVFAFVQSAVGPRVNGDALLLAGTNVRALGALSLLKISYDVPIVTSNLAVLQALKREIENLREREMARLSS